MSRESVDVFAFLVEDEEPEGPETTTKSENDRASWYKFECTYPGCKKRFARGEQQRRHENTAHEKTPSVRDESDDESVVRSTHSDSGISMGDSVFGNNSLIDTRLPLLLEDVQEKAEAETAVPRRDESNRSRRIQWKWPDVPRATHKHHLPDHVGRTTSPERIRVHIPPIDDSLDRGYVAPTPALSGYDLVADRLASEELSPTFRSFKKIKFRVLLQLQDEILEMEQQLAALDITDTQSRLNSDGSTSPASRRLSWQWGQSDLPAHRFHILGRLSLKLEQYCTCGSLQILESG